MPPATPKHASVMLLEAKVHRSFEFVALRIGFKLSSGVSQLVRMLTRNGPLSDSKPDPTPPSGRESKPSLPTIRMPKTIGFMMKFSQVNGVCVEISIGGLNCRHGFTMQIVQSDDFFEA